MKKRIWVPWFWSAGAAGVVTLVGSLVPIFPIAVIALLPAVLVSFWLWGGPESVSPLARNLALQVLDYLTNVLAWSGVFYGPARWLYRRSVLGHENGQPA